MSGRWKIKHPDMRDLALRARDLLPPSNVTLRLGAARAQQARRPAGQRGPRRRRARRGVVAGRQHGRAAGAGRRLAATAARPAEPRARLVGWDGELGTPTTTVLLRHGETAAHGREAVQRLRRARPGAVRPRACARQRPSPSGSRATVVSTSVVSSPMRRTRQTADAVASALGAGRARGRRLPRVRVRRVGGADVRRGAGGLAGAARRRGWATPRPSRRAGSPSPTYVAG